MPVASTPARTRRRVDLLDWLGRRHGVAHTSDARAVGIRAAEIAAAVQTGRVRRVRRSWLVTADCDPRRVQAASVSGRVTCVTAAEMQGLWVSERATDTHVAVAGTASRLEVTGLHLHWSTGPAPVGRNVTEDPAVNILFHVAHCLSQRDATAVWESAVRKKKIAADVLPRVAWRSADAAAIASVASALSDSGLETRFANGMRAAGIPMKQQVLIEGHPLDGLIGERLGIQIDGFEFHSEADDRRRDIRHDARLALLGFTVLRFDYVQILFHWDEVLATIQAAIAQGLHRAPRTRNR